MRDCAVLKTDVLEEDCSANCCRSVLRSEAELTGGAYSAEFGDIVLERESKFMPLVVVYDDVVPIGGCLTAPDSTRPVINGIVAVRCAEVNSEECVLSHRAAVIFNLETELEASLIRISAFQVKIRVKIEDSVVSPCSICLLYTSPSPRD